MTEALETARQEWEAAHETVHALSASDRRRFDRLRAQIDVVGDELRRRVGQTFTLDELVRAYRDADPWVRDAVEEHAPAPGWPRDLALVQGAAFHLYQRGATDYAP